MLKPKPNCDLKFTFNEVVEMFLNINKDWWETKKNALFGKKEEARKTLLQGINTNTHYTLVYVYNKFESEFMCNFEEAVQQQN